MKNLLFIAYNFPPDSRSGTYRTLHFANHLAWRGNYHVHILTVDHHYYDQGFHPDWNLLNQIHDKVSVHRTKCWQLRDALVSMRNPGKQQGIQKNSQVRLPGKLGRSAKRTQLQRIWQRAKDLLTDEMLSFPDRQIGWLPFAIKDGIRVISKKQIDILFATGSPWTSFLVGTFLNRMTRIPLVLDYRDPWIDNPYLDPVDHKISHRIAKIVERQIVDQAEGVILNTDALRTLFATKYPNQRKFSTVHNGYFEEELVASELPESEANPGNFVFIHTGDIYGSRSIDNLLQAVHVLSRRNILRKHRVKIFLLGVNPNIAEICIRTLGAELFTKHFVLSERVSHRQCISLLKASDCFLLFQQGTSIQVPRKLFEYMAMRKPILAITPRHGETARIISDSSAGISVEDHTDSIAETMEKLIKDYSYYCHRLLVNQNYKDYEMKRLTVRLEKILDRVPGLLPQEVTEAA